MAIGLNLAEPTASKIIKKVSKFSSPDVDDFKMIHSKYYHPDKSPLNPEIETLQFTNSDKVQTEFSSRKFQNGCRFEVYKLPDEIIKVFKNKFGEIKAFKSSIEQHNQTPSRTYENVKDAMRAQTHNFLI